MLSGHSTDFASETAIGGGIELLTQTYSGTFSITAPECHTVCLAGAFVDIQSGPVGGFALTLAASTPPVAGLTFTSDVIPAGYLNLPLGFALSKTALTDPVTFDCSSPLGCTLGSTSANVSGIFSAGVPEPSTWVMMFLGFAGLGFAGYRSSRPKIALTD
jgi:hypothetical protein